MKALQNSLVAAIVRRGPRPPVIDRTGHGLATYVDGYRLRLRECLADDFPGLRTALGVEAFERLADRVIDEAPSTDRTLNRWSRRLPAWLATHPRAAPAWARDVAAVEWARVETIHAPLAAPFDRAALAALPPDAWAALRLEAAPTLRLVPVRWRLVDDAVRRDPATMQLSRTTDGLHTRVLAPAAGRLLQALAAGATLDDAVASARLPSIHLQAVLATAMSDGCFTRILPCTSPRP